MSRESQGTAYDTWHRHQNALAQEWGPWHMWVRQELALQDLRGKRIVEIGCGRGLLADHISRMEPAPELLVGCDYSAEAVRFAQQRYGSSTSLTWRKEDIQDLHFENESFDIAISCETIEHVPRPERAILELYRVLKPGGRLYLTCPNYFNAFGIWCMYRRMIGRPFMEGNQPFVKYLQFPAVRFWLARTGFRVNHFHTSHLIMPMRRPRTFFEKGVPRWLAPFGYRSYHVADKRA